MPAGEFAAWWTAYDCDPWGDERADLRAAVGHAIADSARLKENPKPYKTYMPFYREPEEKHPGRGDPAAARKIWSALAAAWNKATGRNKAVTGKTKKK